MRIVSDIIAYCSQNMPKFNTVSISGYHMMEAGANSVLQTAFTLADGLEYVRAALDAGLDIDAICPAALFLLRCGHELFHGDRHAAGRPLPVARPDQPVQPPKPQIEPCCAPMSRPRAGA
jgi:hypothetical protein